tara:strand:+ start:3229 stop:3597 length:369 start_codon:yes stop_codon:yes gene_type:complete
MATLTATLTLGSSNTVSNESLALTISKDLTVGKPLVNSGSVLATSASAVPVFTAAGVTTISYVYAKNTDGSNSVNLEFAAGSIIAVLGPGEFAFIPWPAATGLSVQGVGGDCICEFAYFAKA